MNTRIPRKPLIAAAIAGLLSAGFASTAGAVDEEAARTLARQSNCFKCHSVDKKKEAPPWKEVAAKYRAKNELAKSEARLITHITSGEKVKFEDGHEEDHAIVKTKDQAAIKNLIQWILSLK